MTDLELEGYFVRSAIPLAPAQAERLVRLFERPHGDAAGALEGRTAVTRADLDGVGRVVVKHYMRGGFLRHLISSRYVRSGPTRSRVEYEMLERVRSLGVQAPEPIAHAERGGWLYRAWLVTREIADQRSLAEISRVDEERARTAMGEVIRFLDLLISNGIFHVDLHPGNVVVDRAGGVYLLDFDKARAFPGARNELRDRYLHRWRRAVIKHELPDILAECACLGLRRSYA